jgi:hypothetical protein
LARATRRMSASSSSLEGRLFHNFTANKGVGEAMHPL